MIRSALWVVFLVFTIFIFQATAKLKDKKCGDNLWGQGCTKKCNCNAQGATSCSPKTGCVCRPGWKGKFCYQDVDECLSKGTCPNSKCLNNHGSYRCVASCSDGFEYANGTCVDIDECLTNNGGCAQRCVNLKGSFMCECLPGYKVDTSNSSLCEECEKGKWGENCWMKCRCDKHRTSRCDHAKGCVCKPGWTGFYCNQDIDECRTANKCGRHGICINSIGSHKCTCRPGFERKKNRCVDVDECKKTSICSRPHQRCINMVGYYKCICDPGHKMESGRCVCEAGYSTKSGLCDTCGDDRWGKKCQTNCRCNEIGTKSCSRERGCICRPGWTGAHCYQDVDECRDGKRCPGSKCLNTHGSYKCVAACSSGFKYTKSKCVDINECDTKNGGCADKCHNLDGSFMCECSAGYKLNTTDKSSCIPCEERKWGVNCWSNCDCDGNHTTRCDHVKGCLCKPGWQGADCSEDVDECKLPNTCGPYAKCHNNEGSYTCKCHRGFQKANGKCVDINECDDGTRCSGLNQKCVNKPGYFECVCEREYYMKFGQCVCARGYKEKSGKCTKCDEGFYGEDCANKCDCAQRHSLMCHHVAGCLCRYGWGGIRCTKDINECRDFPTLCGSHAICTNKPGGYDCSCVKGYEMDANNHCVKKAAAKP